MTVLKDTNGKDRQCFDVYEMKLAFEAGKEGKSFMEGFEQGTFGLDDFEYFMYKKFNIKFLHETKEKQTP